MHELLISKKNPPYWRSCSALQDLDAFAVEQFGVGELVLLEVPVAAVLVLDSQQHSVGHVHVVVAGLGV